MDKIKNVAPTAMVGTYNLIIGGNEVRLVNVSNPAKCVTVRCHPDDAFDIGEAVKLAFSRINTDNNIRIGDTVEVVDSGNSYATFNNWSHVDIEYAIRYRYGVCPENGIIGKVVRIVENKYIIQVENASYLGNSAYSGLNCHDCVYVLDRRALKKIKDGRYE